MSDQTPPPSDETAPIAGRRPPSGPTPEPAPAPAAAPPPGFAAAPAPTDPAHADPPPAAAYDVPPVDGPAPGRSWRDRLRRGTASGGNRTFGLGALVAGTLAGLIIGGAAGSAIGAAVSDEDHDRGGRFEHMERGFRGGPGDGDDRGSFGQLPPGVVPVPPGTAPRATPPSDEDDDGQPDGSSNS